VGPRPQQQVWMGWWSEKSRPQLKTQHWFSDV
jgi:hypothetical protein